MFFSFLFFIACSKACSEDDTRSCGAFRSAPFRIGARATTTPRARPRNLRTVAPVRDVTSSAGAEWISDCVQARRRARVWTLASSYHLPATEFFSESSLQPMPTRPARGLCFSAVQYYAPWAGRTCARCPCVIVCCTHARTRPARGARVTCVCGVARARCRCLSTTATVSVRRSAVQPADLEVQRVRPKRIPGSANACWDDGLLGCSSVYAHRTPKAKKFKGFAIQAAAALLF